MKQSIKAQAVMSF